MIAFSAAVVWFFARMLGPWVSARRRIVRERFRPEQSVGESIFGTPLAD